MTQRTEKPGISIRCIERIVTQCNNPEIYLSPADVQIKYLTNILHFIIRVKLANNLTIEDLKSDKYPAYAK